MEIDGPNHFYGRTYHRLYDFNNTLMQMANFNLVRLPHHDFRMPGQPVDANKVILAVKKAGERQGDYRKPYNYFYDLF